MEEKNKEKLERWGKKVKKDPKETAVEEKAKGKKDFAKGCILKVCGINDEELTREVIKTTLVNLGAEVAFIQFSKGEKEALVRLNSQEEGAATQVWRMFHTIFRHYLIKVYVCFFLTQAFLLSVHSKIGGWESKVWRRGG